MLSPNILPHCVLPAVRRALAQRGGRSAQREDLEHLPLAQNVHHEGFLLLSPEANVQ
jgi:hypothetical protein